jgi:hypothetical protein
VDLATFAVANCKSGPTWKGWISSSIQTRWTRWRAVSTPPTREPSPGLGLAPAAWLGFRGQTAPPRELRHPWKRALKMGRVPMLATCAVHVS